MKLTIITLISILFIIGSSATYQALQKQYKAMRIQTISTLIPSIILQTNPPKKVLVNVQKFFNITQTDQQQQLKEYEENFGKFIHAFGDWKNKNWKADPQLSAVFDLTQMKRNESFIVKGIVIELTKGRQNSILVMDIIVNNLDTLNTKNDGIAVFVTNLSGLNQELQKLAQEQKANKFQQTLSKHIEFKTSVKKHIFLSIPFSSDVYQIWVVRQPIDTQPFTGVHLSMQMGIQQDPVPSQNKQKSNLTPQQQQQMVNSIKQIVQQNNLTFLDSLQLWEKVDQHRMQHERSYQWNEAVELYQCLGLVVMYVVEYLVLRFIARKKQVV